MFPVGFSSFYLSLSALLFMCLLSPSFLFWGVSSTFSFFPPGSYSWSYVQSCTYLASNLCFMKAGHWRLLLRAGYSLRVISSAAHHALEPMYWSRMLLFMVSSLYVVQPARHLHPSAVQSAPLNPHTHQSQLLKFYLFCIRGWFWTQLVYRRFMLTTTYSCGCLCIWQHTATCLTRPVTLSSAGTQSLTPLTHVL